MWRLYYYVWSGARGNTEGIESVEVEVGSEHQHGLRMDDVRNSRISQGYPAPDGMGAAHANRPRNIQIPRSYESERAFISTRCNAAAPDESESSRIAILI